MKTTELITNFINKKKIILLIYLISCILYFPLNTATFTIAFGKLFEKINNFTKNKLEIINLLYIIVILYTIVNISVIVKEKLESKLIPEFNNEIRNMIFENIIHKMKINFKEIDLGELISRISMITVKWDEIVHYIASVLLPQSLTLLVLLGILAYIGPKYSLITFGYIFVVFILLLPRYKLCMGKFVNLRHTMTERHNHIQDKISNLFDIYLSNKEEYEIRNNKEKEYKFNKYYKDALHCNVINSFMISVFNVLYLSFMVYLTIRELYSNKLSKSSTITILLIITYVTGCTDNLFKTITWTIQAYSILKESEEFLNYISDYKNKIGGKKPIIYGNIKLNNVTFKYKNNIVIKNINLNIQQNNKIIIKGKSGSGKTTIIKLICGFYNTTKGSLLIENINIKDIDIDYLRSNISMVNQNVKLFNISIYDNIKYGNNSISNKMITNFIKTNKINLYNDINLHSKVGQHGNNLSGGQKQMTLIIRVLLNSKKILIFDEPTSALDNYHFEVFNNIITKSNKTIIVITHDTRFDKTKFNNRYHLENGHLKKIL